MKLKFAEKLGAALVGGSILLIFALFTAALVLFGAIVVHELWAYLF